MSYQMTSGPNMTHPYPPPATAIASPPRSRFSKWWPISFFLAAVLFFIIGGGLLGGWTAHAYDCVDSSYYSSCSSVGNLGMWYGAVACFAIGGICKLVAWILFIVWCVKRSAREARSIAYTYQPLAYANAPIAPTAAAPTYQNAPPYQNAHVLTPARSKEPMEMGTRYCGQCGTGVTTPFCPHCGIQV
ncbi:Zinc-ribbon domain-containing protein [Madurella fahalii]|uniref:Zinc-ribbon domain-containing protein n=1 Tax=Madurella fahalii TaxID=1157608 RepID=A0ABQ0GJB5_9PEZI